ncbi:MAG: hypothetical protein ETSY1_23835 [Candidatus Entotheonella factor]|uniref:Uncharacterized protein n=1 Tax=Entotheonella factor TaxID=1429438 RepID=W4LGV6_ENTF1|nr:MAG: hypothetical protein ETSY1_23835 [Candidatus Entotheonella factor]
MTRDVLGLITAIIALLAALLGIFNSFYNSNSLKSQKTVIIEQKIILQKQIEKIGKQKIDLEQQKIQLDEQKTKLEALKNCRGEIVVSVNQPQQNAQVKREVDVSGTSTVHEICRYIFLILRDVSSPGLPWKIVDIVQVNTNGRWAGKIVLDGFPIGTEVEIEARGIGRSDAYTIGEPLPVPPEKGVPSNIIHVRRVE